MREGKTTKEWSERGKAVPLRRLGGRLARQVSSVGQDDWQPTGILALNQPAGSRLTTKDTKSTKEWSCARGKLSRGGVWAGG